MTFREVNQKMEEILKSLPKPDYNYVPNPCINKTCLLWDGICGQSPKSLNYYFNKAINNFINKYYAIY